MPNPFVGRDLRFPRFGAMRGAGGGGGGGGPVVLTVGLAAPRLVADGDSVIANRPGARDMITGYLGDLVYFPDGWMQAQGGQTAAAILAGIQATVDLIVPGQTIVLMGPMGANQGEGSQNVAEMWPQQSEVFDTLLAAGAVVVAIPTLPDEDSYGNNAEKDALRDLVYAYQDGGVISYLGVDYTVTAHANFYAVDIGIPNRGLTGSAAYGAGAFNPYTMKNDQSHPNTNLGAPYLAEQVQAILRPLVSGSALPIEADAGNLLGVDWNFPGSTAATGTGVTGQRPTGWAVARQTGTGTWTLSKDGEGNLVASITSAPDNTILQVSKALTFTGAEGDVFDMIAEIEVDPATTEYRGASVSFRGTGGATAATQSYGTPTSPLRLRSSGVPLTGTVTSDTARITVSVGPGGSGTFVFKRAAVRLRANVSNALTIAGSPATSGQVGAAYSFTPTVEGGAAPYAFDLASGTLPGGLTLNASTGAITGTLTTAGAFEGIALRVTDSASDTATLTPFGVTVTVAGVPVNTALPTISGLAEVGQTLTASPGTWTNSPTGYTYQWLSSGFTISGATSATYIPVSGDAGQTMSVRVVASNANGNSAEARSAETDVVSGGAAAIAGFDPTYNTGSPLQLAYSDENRTVAATANISGIRFTRGDIDLPEKCYFEVELTSGGNSVGVSTAAVTATIGGANGVVRTYWAGTLAFTSDGSVSMGQNVVTADGGVVPRIQIAVDRVAARVWFRKYGVGNWNNSATANPETGVGGFSISGMNPATNAIYAYVGLANSATANATLDGTADRFAYDAPSGFAAIA